MTDREQIDAAHQQFHEANDLNVNDVDAYKPRESQSEADKEPIANSEDAGIDDMIADNDAYLTG